jgi:hypothetical protein
MNIERFKTIVNRIKDNPSCWNQREWHCGSAHCVAGHAQIDAIKVVNFTTVRRDATEWLDLTLREANWLFASNRTIKDFEAVIDQGGVYDSDGYDIDGFDRDGYNRYGYDYFGYDYFGYNRNGYNRNGYNRAGYNRLGYDCNGYDCDGYDIDGFDRDGLDRNNKPR